MNMSIMAERSAGRTRRSVTRWTVWVVEAPLVMAASSRAGSIERKLALSIRNTTGIQKVPSITIMAGIVNTSSSTRSVWKTDRNSSFRVPVRGPSRKIQPTVRRMPGTAKLTKLAA